mgnify:CR=1 FL=1
MKAKAQMAKMGIGTQQKQVSMFSFLMINYKKPINSAKIHKIKTR